MTASPRQGEVWWSEYEEGARPVLIVSRSSAGGHLNKLIVAPVTRTVRGIRTEIALGPESGLRTECAASFDNLRAWPVPWLRYRLGSIDLPRARICEALAAVADC